MQLPLPSPGAVPGCSPCSSEPAWSQSPPLRVSLQMQKNQQHPVRWLHRLFAAHQEASPHDQHTETPCLHRQRWPHSPARPSKCMLDQGSQNIPGHALLKPSLKHSPNLNLFTMDKQHPSAHPWQHQAQHPPSSSKHPNECHVPRGATTLQAKRQDYTSKQFVRDSRYLVWLPCLSFPARPAAALHPAELIKCLEIHRHHLFVRVKPAPLNVVFPSTRKKQQP